SVFMDFVVVVGVEVAIFQNVTDNAKDSEERCCRNRSTKTETDFVV
ncbi:22945_t:CDS:1, partial [Gigaspora rosea]